MTCAEAAPPPIATYDQTVTEVDHRLVVVAYSWAGGRPHLRIRPPDAGSTLVEASEFSLRYRVDETPVWHCPGRIPFRSGRGDYIDCMNRPQPGSRRCTDCAVAEATLAGSLHHAHTREADELDVAVDAHLQQPNVLYLAGFGDGSVKVGTSTVGRTDQRLLEQGALMVLVVAEADDGIVVRRLEDLVTERLGLPQSVGVARKLRGLVTPIPAARLEADLTAAADGVHQLVEETDPTGVKPTREPWINPGHQRIIDEKLFAYPADLRHGAHHLTIDHMVGRLAVAVGPRGDRFVVDAGRIFGLELESGDFETVELAVQDSLF